MNRVKSHKASEGLINKKAVVAAAVAAVAVALAMAGVLFYLLALVIKFLVFVAISAASAA